MKSRFAYAMAVVSLLASSVRADEVAVIANPPTFFTIVIFAAACACIAVCFQVLALVRGGQFSRSWQLFLAGFTVLAVSQLGLMLHNFGVIVMPSWLVPTLMAAMAGVFFYGLYETKRMLS
jgi:uncharacterized membrane protein